MPILTLARMGGADEKERGQVDADGKGAVLVCRSQWGVTQPFLFGRCAECVDGTFRNQRVQRVEVECVRCWPESGFVGGKEVVVRLGAGVDGWKCDGQVNAVMVRPLTRGHQASAMRLRQDDMSIIADDELGNYPNKQGQVYSALARLGRG